MRNSFYFVFGLMIAGLLLLPYLSHGARSSENEPSKKIESKTTLKAPSLKQPLKPSVSGSKGSVTFSLPFKVKDKMPKVKVKSSAAPSSSTSIK